MSTDADDLKRLLAEAKAASNYLHHPEMLSDREISPGVAMTASALYRLIVEIEDRWRAENRPKWW